MEKEREAKMLIELIWEYSDEDIDLCDLDGGGTSYLIGYNELRYPDIVSGEIVCDSNIHKKDSNGNDIDCEYEQIFWCDMTDYEKETLVNYLRIFLKYVI